MKKQSIIQPILDAIDETDGTIAKHMNQLIKWSKYCEKSIGTLNGYPFKSSFVTVSGAMIDQPDDCYKVHALLLGNYTDRLNLKYLNSSLGTVSVDQREDFENNQLDVEFVWQDLSSSIVPAALWEEIGDKVSLASEYQNQEMTMIYQYLETDAKGYWLINDGHVEAVKRYLIYMIAKKFLFKNFKSSKMTRANDVQLVEMYRRDYNIAIRNARAQDNQESPIDNTNGWKFATK